MKYVYLALNWTFGVLFLLRGLVSLIESPLGGLSLVAISALLLPPVRSFVYSKTNKELPVKARAISIFVLFVAFGIFVGQTQEKKAQELAAQQAQEQAEKIAQLRQEDINYFNANREQIVSSAKAALGAKEYQSVVSQSSKYLVSGYNELEQLNSQAKAELAEIQKAEKAAREKAEREAKTKVKKEREMRIAKFGEAPAQSARDGSYLAVERYLERIANDPDSIKIDGCTKVYHTESGWLVGCDYRGRNAFGGMIRQSNWFTIVHGSVIQMHDASAYQP